MNKKIFSLLILSAFSLVLMSFSSSQAMKRKAETDIVTQAPTTDQANVQEAPYLPEELIAKIIGYLRPYHKNIAMQVNKSFDKAIKDRELMLQSNPATITEEDIKKSLFMYAADANKINQLKAWLDYAKVVNANKCSCLKIIITDKNAIDTKKKCSCHKIINDKNTLGLTPFYVASNANNTDAMQLLNSYGAKASLWSPEIHPLHIAAYNNHTIAAKIMLDQKINPDVILQFKEDYETITPLCIAIARGDIDMVELLANHNAKLTHEIDYGDYPNLTPIQWATICAFPEIIKIVINATKDLSNDNYSLLHACSNDLIEIARLLIGAGIDINKGNNFNETPLYYASNEGHLAIVKELLSRGALVNKKTNMGSTALHCASEKGHIYIVKELLNYGAQVNEQDNQNKTPLDYASERGYIDVVKELLNCEQISFDKATMEWAQQKGHTEIVKLLQDHQKHIALQREREQLNAMSKEDRQLCDDFEDFIDTLPDKPNKK